MNKKNIVLILIYVVLIIASYNVICYCKNSSMVKVGDKYLPLYKEVMTDLFESNYRELAYSEYIAVDVNSFNITSELDKKMLYEFLKTYNSNIIFGSLSMLEDTGFIDEFGVLKGVLVRADNLEFVGNKVIGSCGIYRGSSSSKGYNFKASYRSGKWKIKYKSYFIS